MHLPTFPSALLHGPFLHCTHAKGSNIPASSSSGTHPLSIVSDPKFIPSPETPKN